MKLIIASCFLLSSAFAQQTAQPVQTESHASSLTVSFTGQQEGFYQFRIANRSSHAVTAFALSAVPSGIENGPNAVACGNRCSGSFVLGDTARPVIKAGASVTQRFAISSMNGGALVLNAAVFDDASYEGEDTSAAQLVARQTGRQAEYDRIVAAVNLVFTTDGNGSDASRTAFIRMKLGDLSTNLDAKMVSTFKSWFPELAGCIQQYAPLMKNAAASEKQQVVESMEQFVHGNAGNSSLAQWWQTAQEVLASAGCSGCGNANPKPHSPKQNVSAKCQAPTIIFTASLADDGTEEETAEAALDPEDAALLDEDASTEASVSEPAEADPTEAIEAAPAETEVAGAVPPPMHVPNETKRTMLGAGVSFIPAPDGRGMLLRRVGLGAVPDDMLYRSFFRDIVNLGDMALQEEVRWIDGQQVEDNGPRAGGLSKLQISILKQTAADCNDRANQLKTKTTDLMVSSVSGYPVGWLIYAPPISGIRELKDQETASINKCIARLRSNLGSSFFHLQGFVKKVYGTSPGEVRTISLSDDALYANYLRYLATLDDLAATNLRAKKEAAQRQQELIGAGLGERDRALVTKTAQEYNGTVATLYEIPKGEIAIFDRSFAGSGARAITASPGTQARTGVMPTPAMATVQAPGPGMAVVQVPIGISPAASIMPAVQTQLALPVAAVQIQPSNIPGTAMPGLAQPYAVPATATRESQDARTKERKHKADEAQLSLLTGLAQLQAGMSAPVYKKFDAYLHKLYADALAPRVVTFMGQGLGTSMPTSKSEQQ